MSEDEIPSTQALQEEHEENATKIATLESQVADLLARVETLEGYHA